MTYMADALMDALIAFARAGAKGPMEIVLPTREFLWLAGDLGADNKESPLHHAWRPEFPEFNIGVTDPQAPNAPIANVRVGDSFVFHGPTGPVTIRDAKEASK